MEEVGQQPHSMDRILQQMQVLWRNGKPLQITGPAPDESVAMIRSQFPYLEIAEIGLEDKHSCDVGIRLEDGAELLAIALSGPAANGRFALIDNCKRSYCLGVDGWNAVEGKYTCYAASTRNGRLLHRFIFFGDEKSKLLVDHANSSGLDCRLSNLRPCTHSENAKNRRIGQGKRYKGIAQVGDKWRAQITSDGTIHRLGTFPTPEDAARAYDEAATRLHGEFARLNFYSGRIEATLG